MLRPGTSSLPAPRLVIFDLDGVVYRGDQPVAGAAALAERLHRRGVLVRYATNNSTATRDDFVARLLAMGIAAGRDEVVTSTWATIEHLRRHQSAVRRILAVGERGLIAELAAAGYDVTPAAEVIDGVPDGAPPALQHDACVVGLDRSFDYRRLAAAAAAIRGGARFIATNADVSYPTTKGWIPGAAAMVAAVAAAAGRQPLVIGKPAPEMFHVMMEAADVPAAQTVVVGDNPDADVVAARRAGVRSILVLTGVTDRALAADLDGERRPDVVADGPAEVGEIIGSWLAG